MGGRRDAIFTAVAAAGRRAHRARLRRRANRYLRDADTLLYWTFPDSRPEVVGALGAPHDAAATRALCRALYRDWRAARALPSHRIARPMRIDALRTLFACECRLYRRQAASQAAQHGLADFLGRLAAAG